MELSIKSKGESNQFIVLSTSTYDIEFSSRNYKVSFDVKDIEEHDEELSLEHFYLPYLFLVSAFAFVSMVFALELLGQKVKKYSAQMKDQSKAKKQKQNPTTSKKI